MTTATSAQCTVTFTEEEQKELLRLLENSLTETHVEARRTEAPAFQQQLHRQEAVLRALIDKVRGLCF
jgi:hypothetical protein